MHDDTQFHHGLADIKFVIGYTLIQFISNFIVHQFFDMVYLIPIYSHHAL